ncbi:hypothetical protein ABKW01_22470, partial [Enterobacter hormaechei]
LDIPVIAGLDFEPGMPGFFTPDCSQKLPSAPRALYLSFCTIFLSEDAVPWILLLLFSLFSAPSLAVTLPGVTTGATATCGIHRCSGQNGSP